MVKFSLSRNFPDLEIHDHNTQLKISRETPWAMQVARVNAEFVVTMCTCRSIWTPVIDKVLVYERDLEQHNIHDPFAVVEGSLMGPWGPEK